MEAPASGSKNVVLTPKRLRRPLGEVARRPVDGVAMSRWSRGQESEQGPGDAASPEG